jgi:hypothetical protein
VTSSRIVPQPSAAPARALAPRPLTDHVKTLSAILVASGVTVALIMNGATAQPKSMPAAVASTWDAILTCQMGEQTGFMIKDGRVEDYRSPYPRETVFADLDSARPIMKDHGLVETRLTVIRRDPDAVWLMEQPPRGGVNVFTLFRDSKQVILSQQRRVSTPTSNVVQAITEIGQCR